MRYLSPFFVKMGFSIVVLLWTVIILSFAPTVYSTVYRCGDLSERLDLRDSRDLRDLRDLRDSLRLLDLILFLE